MPMIIGEIRRYLRDNSALRVSRSLRDMAYKALQAKEEFVRQHQREPDIVELAKMMDVPKEEVVLALDAILDPVSLFEPVFHDGADTVCVMDQVGDSKNTDEQWLARIALKEAIDNLNEREKKIIRLRFFEGRTQMEVAEEIHISQAQVSRLEKGALDRSPVWKKARWTASEKIWTEGKKPAVKAGFCKRKYYRVSLAAFIGAVLSVMREAGMPCRCI